MLLRDKSFIPRQRRLAGCTASHPAGPSRPENPDSSPSAGCTETPALTCVAVSVSFELPLLAQSALSCLLWRFSVCRLIRGFARGPMMRPRPPNLRPPRTPCFVRSPQGLCFEWRRGNGSSRRSEEESSLLSLREAQRRGGPPALEQATWLVTREQLTAHGSAYTRRSSVRSRRCRLSRASEEIPSTFR